MKKSQGAMVRRFSVLMGSVAALALVAGCAGTPQEADPVEVVEATPQAEPSPYEYPFQDPSLSPEERAADIVSRLTLEEKAAQMYDKAAAIPRLGIPEYNWWNEALHGVARAGHATVFPQAIGLAATWDEDLMLTVADVISTEGRAKHHDFLREGVRDMYTGLTFWSPNINIFRDPRWGRGMETYGEDPFLTGRMAVNFVNGLQGDDPTYLKTVATVKHYAVHSGPEPSRHRDDYVATDADLYETYLSAFKMSFDETGVASVMCAYNAVWGAPACGSERLMVDLLRGELGFDGYVVSDCGAIGDFYYDAEKIETGEAHYIGHDYVDDRAEAAALAVKMGTDLNCGDGYGNKMDALPEAVDRGLIEEATIDQAVQRLFEARIRLGMLDDPSIVPWASIPASEIASEEHLALSAEAARKSLVLLKNDGILPLAEGTKVAVIGPNADNWLTLVANYYGLPTQPVTALDGIEAKIGGQNVNYSAGSEMAPGIYVNERAIPSGVLFHDDGGEMKPGLSASYWSDPDRTGDPAFTRVDDNVDFYWIRSPVDDSRNDEFSTVWTGYIVPEADGEYIVSTTRFSQATVNGEPVSNTPIPMKAGEAYPVEVTLTMRKGWPRNTIEPDARLSWVNTSVDLRAEALAAAEDAEVILFFGGIDANLEGEEMDVEVEGFLGGDRTSLEVPAPQLELLEALKATGKPIVVVNFSGSAMALNWADEHANAVVQAFYPGEKTGDAIADLLWGEFSPSGRLPVTFYRSLEGLPEFGDYSMQNRTYKYYTGTPLYPFGYGLSYTEFTYTDLEAPKVHDASGPLTVSVNVTNSGEMAGREVVQVYLSQSERANESVPIRELVGFDVVELEPGETKRVEITISPDRLGWYDTEGKLVTPTSGSIELTMGGGQPKWVAENQRETTVIAFSE